MSSPQIAPEPIAPPPPNRLAAIMGDDPEAALSVSVVASVKQAESRMQSIVRHIEVHGAPQRPIGSGALGNAAGYGIPGRSHAKRKQDGFCVAECDSVILT